MEGNYKLQQMSESICKLLPGKKIVNVCIKNLKNLNQTSVTNLISELVDRKVDDVVADETSLIFIIDSGNKLVLKLEKNTEMGLFFENNPVSSDVDFILTTSVGHQLRVWGSFSLQIVTLN